MSCTCARPSEHPNPRHKGTCVKCNHPLPTPPPSLMHCFKCGNRFDPAKGRVGIFLSPGGSVIEELAETKVRQLCPECGVSLRTWLGPQPREYIELGPPEWDYDPT